MISTGRFIGLGGKSDRRDARRTNGTLSDAELSELVELLRALIRIKSVNPPGDEILAARYLEQVLADEGIPPTVVEPFPGRGSIVARVRGDGTGGDPLLLLSHLDVVPGRAGGLEPRPVRRRSGGRLRLGPRRDGHEGHGRRWRRRSCAASPAPPAQAGRDPATDPIPGLRRDVIFCSSADEEAGGWHGADWLVNKHPDWLAGRRALNEAGGIATTYGGVRFYPIQVAEKGFVVYRLHVKGRWGHGSVPTPDNAAVLAAQIVMRLAEPGPVRLTEPIAVSLVRAIPHLTAAPARSRASGRPRQRPEHAPGSRATIDRPLSETCATRSWPAPSRP